MTEQSANPRGIVKIEVEKLFGLYDYALAPPISDPSSLFILYGDNGSGKTTILKLLVHLLWPERGGGHRTAIARIAFKSFKVTLADATEIIAFRPAVSTGSYAISFYKAGNEYFSISVILDPEGRVRDIPNFDLFVQRLKDLRIAIYFLSDDRRIETNLFKSADENETDDPPLFRYRSEPVFVPDANVYWRSASHLRETENAEDSLVRSAVRRAERWVGGQTLKGSNTGDALASTNYVEIMQRVSQSGVSDEGPSYDELVRNLELQVLRSRDYSRLGLIAAIKVDDLFTTLMTAQVASRGVLRNVLAPYVDSIKSKLDALADLKEAVERLLNNLNTFFNGRKHVSFKLGRGFRILSALGERLAPDVLSSGEKQLLQLFCNTLVARDHPTIFIIDEPEISLNVKWERHLIKALLEIVSGSKVQFVLATHSLEIMAQHRQNVARLSKLPFVEAKKETT